MALGPADHDTLANMQRSVKGTEFFVLGGSDGAPRVRCLSGLWRTASLPWPGVEGRPWSPREGMDIPQGGEGYGALQRDRYAVDPCPPS